MKLSEVYHKYKGILYCFLFAVMTTTQSNMAKVLTSSSNYSYITFIRCFFLIFTLPFSLLIEAEEANTYDTTDLILYLTCGILGVIPCATAVLSFTLMGVGDSTAIEFGGSLILVGVVGHLVLDEKLSIWYSILLLVDCVGIILVAKPSFIFGTSEQGMTSKEIGAIVAFAGAFFLCIFQVCVRKLEKRNSLQCYLLVAVQGLVGMVISGAWTTMESAWEIPCTWLKFCILVGYGLVSFMQFTFATEALANVEAKNVAMASTLSVVLSYVLQIAVFEEEVDGLSIGGAVLITLCVMSSASFDYVLKKLDGCRNPYEKLCDETTDEMTS